MTAAPPPARAPGPAVPAGVALVEGPLAAVTEQLGTPLPDQLRAAFHRVPRHLFLPDRVWLRDGAGGYAPCDQSAEPERWLATAYADEPLVTQFTDGLPSSSASMPSMVARTLLLTGLTPLSEPAGAAEADGERVPKLGAGTGFNAGLLCALLGEGSVTTIEVDPVLAGQAEENLKTAGYAPLVVREDAADGAAGSGPCYRILATFSVDHIPPAWPAQVRPGGRIVTPWTSAWCRY
ncbi:hypothetical protein [Streptomyces sp. NPDC093111]|uniref:protein-L-isoaspartate O-methyltransferase family protein n=1 Tax=Streptomyces sp. NPDC093111 TaxID=3154978 RepID=UPI003443D2C7